MPLFEVLYYPHFEPSELWLRRFLLIYDKVWSVIPKDAHHVLSRGIKEHIDVIPDSFGTLSPIDRDKSADRLSLSRLDKAFEQIRCGKTYAKKQDQIILTINKHNFDIGIGGSYSLLHYDKFNRQVYELLKKHNLCSEDASSFFQSIGGSKDFIAMDPSAANIIMSNLADNIARRKALNTITDQNIAFMVTTLNSLDHPIPLHIDARDWLVSSIIKFEIPADIQYMNLREYKELRDSYAEIKIAFHTVVSNISSLYRLDKIDDLQTMRDMVKDILADLNKEVRTYKQTRYGRTFVRWVPFSVGNLIALAGMAVGIITGDNMVSTTSAGASILFRFIDKALSPKGERDREKLVRMLSGVKKDIINSTDVKRLI
jgi:hypothetical protein